MSKFNFFRPNKPRSEDEVRQFVLKWYRKVGRYAMHARDSVKDKVNMQNWLHVRSGRQAVCTMSHLPDLPNELWIRIFSFAIIEDFLTLQAIGQVSTHWKALVKVPMTEYYKQEHGSYAKDVHPLLVNRTYCLSGDFVDQSGLRAQGPGLHPASSEPAIFPPVRELFVLIACQRNLFLQILKEDGYITVGHVLTTLNDTLQQTNITCAIGEEFLRVENLSPGSSNSRMMDFWPQRTMIGTPSRLRVLHQENCPILRYSALINEEGATRYCETHLQRLDHNGRCAREDASCTDTVWCPTFPQGFSHLFAAVCRPSDEG